MQNKEEIASMRQAGMSQDAVAQRFGVKRFELAAFLEKFLPNISSDETIFRNSTKSFLSATNEKERTKAFEEVDKILQKIAAQKAETQGEISYQDCLQDLRLKFLEIMAKKQSKDRIVYTEILQELKKGEKSVPNKDLLQAVLETEPMQDMDTRTKIFENINFLAYMMDNSSLNERERTIVFSYLAEGKSLDEIGMMLGLNKERIRVILNGITEKMKAHYKMVSSNEYLHKRANIGLEITNEIIKKERM